MIVGSVVLVVAIGLYPHLGVQWSSAVFAAVLIGVSC